MTEGANEVLTAQRRPGACSATAGLAVGAAARTPCPAQCVPSSRCSANVQAEVPWAWGHGGACLLLPCDRTARPLHGGGTGCGQGPSLLPGISGCSERCVGVLEAAWEVGVLGVPGERKTLTPRRPHQPKKTRQEVGGCGGQETWEGGIGSPHIPFSCYFPGKVSQGPAAVQSAP